MNASAASMPRWQRILLPGDLVEGPREVRTAGDRLSDGVMWIAAGVIGFVVLAATSAQHSPVGVVFDVAVGVASLASLAWRRSRPVAVGVFAVLASTVSSSHRDAQRCSARGRALA